MSFSDFTWRAQSTIYRDCIDLIGYRQMGDEREVLQPLQMEVKTMKKGEYYSTPSLELSHDSAISLMQALWDAGVRPNDGEGSGEQVRALKSHIEFAEHVAKSLLPASDRVPR